MDNLMLRFPHLFERTFQKLNIESLFKSREVARSWKCFIKERNYSWLRVVNIPRTLQNSNTYLHLAAETGQIGTFETALSEEDDIDIKNMYGETSFQLACKNGRLNIVELLLKSTSLNIDVNARDNYGYTGFFFACQEGHLNVAKVLMEKSVALGIDLNAKDARNPTAFTIACIKGHSDIVQLIIEFSVDTGGIDLNTQNEFGYCAFRWACADGHSDLVKI